MLTLQRLKAIELLASLCSLLWRTDVLPRALYGGEVRNVPVDQLVPLSSSGKAAIGAKAPLWVNGWRAPEVLTGPQFGDTLVMDPVLNLRERKLLWMQLVCNMLKVFRVELTSGSVERVEAEILQVRDGCLIFSRVPTRSELRDEDPRVSRAFAPGSWRTVEETK